MVTINCAICGKETKIFPCRLGKIKCCSWECRNKFISKTKTEIYHKNTIRSHYIQDRCVLNDVTYDGYKVYIDGKYPTIYLNNKNCHLHRYVWEQVNGPIPKNMIIHHKDFNRGNWSLDNLELLTRAEHMKRHKINPIDGTDTLVSHIKIERSEDLS